MFGMIRKYLGEMFHELARQKESRILEGHVAIDHVHMYISIPPKFAVAQVVGFIKGKSLFSRNYDYVGMVTPKASIIFRCIGPTSV
jgi:putative transposase